MQLSKNSWHYKLLRKSGLYIENISLCMYFWKVLTATIVMSLIIVIAVLILICLIAVLISPFIAVPTGFLILGSTFWLLILLIVWLRTKEHIENLDYWDRPRPWWAKPIYDSKKTPIKPPKYISLTSAYIKAKKEKICPFIEWVE